MTKILAIDHGATSGYCLLNDGKLEVAGSFQLLEQNKGARFIEFQVKIRNLIHSYQPDVLSVEKPMHMRGGAVTEILFGYYAMLHVLAYEFNIDLCECNPMTVKKFVTGKGNADKSVVAVMLADKYDIQLDDIIEKDFYKPNTQRKATDVKTIHYDKSDALALADWCWNVKLKGGK